MNVINSAKEEVTADAKRGKVTGISQSMSDSAGELVIGTSQSILGSVHAFFKIIDNWNVIKLEYLSS